MKNEDHYRIIFISSNDFKEIEDNSPDNYLHLSDRGIKNILLPKSRIILIDEAHRVELRKEAEQKDG